MKKVLFKILLPTLFIVFWLNVAYHPCLVDGKLDWYRFWIFAGLPFGIKAMGGVFYPVGFDLQGGIFVLALNVILGGLIGGFALIIRIIKIILAIIDVIVFDLCCRDLEVIEIK